MWILLIGRLGCLLVASSLEDPWFWKAHESERYVECATDTTTAGTISMCFDSSDQERFDAFEFIVLIPLPMLFMISAHDLIAMYLAIEPQSLCFYVIAASKRKSEFSTEAGLKYLILGAFSSGILLFGYDRTTTDIN
ncbi:hypothetical protein N665_1263s0018 [Sinapis alba]|nr:hypothetical protein N665_1263s0018 [Sinapis alba]